MGRMILQMMISVDGMVSGPRGGELDWIAKDEPLNQDHQARLEQASAIILGSGACSEMSGYWKKAEHDEKADPIMRDIARAMNEVRKIVYSHADKPVDWRNAKVHVVESDEALARDVQRLKRETDGTIVIYGGVRLARSFVKQGLLDEIHLDVCPVILGAGERLFTDSTQRTKLRLKKTVAYDSGATKMHYEVTTNRAQST
jgi:dihydrofolate reductase